MFTNTELNQASIDMQVLAKKIKAKEAIRNTDTKTGLSKYMLTLYRVHNNELPTSKWVQITELLAELVQWIRENMVDSQGNFKWPKIWRIFATWRFFKDWITKLVKVIR